MGGKYWSVVGSSGCWHYNHILTNKSCISRVLDLPLECGIFVWSDFNMAQRRMFSKSVTTTARFLQMPASTRLLYYDLGMSADDDGFVESFSILRMTNASEDDLRLLQAKGYIQIINDELTARICDWTINNQIRKDRYTPSIYHHLLPEDDKLATFGVHTDNQQETSGKPNGNQTETEGKPSIGEVSIDKEREGKVIPPKSPQQPKMTNNVKTQPNYKPDWFNRFMELYPRGEDMTGAIEAWDELRPDRELCAIIAEAIKKQKRSKQWKNSKYIPYASNWLRKGKWLDKVEEVGISDDIFM